MSDSETDVDSFTAGIIERAKLRERVIGAGNTLKQSSKACNLPLTVSDTETSDDEMESSSEEENKLPSEFQLDQEKLLDGDNKCDSDQQLPNRRARLGELARRINEWEDDMRHYVPPSSRFNVQCGKKGNLGSSDSPLTRKELMGTSKTSEGQRKETPASITVPVKSPSPIKSLLVSPTKEIHKTDTVINKTVSSSSKIAEKAAIFEKPLAKPLTTSKDPTELSVAERAKLFERQVENNRFGISKPVFRVPIPRPHHTVTQATKPITSCYQTTESTCSLKKHEISVSLPPGKVLNQCLMFEAGKKTAEGVETMEVAEDLPLVKPALDDDEVDSDALSVTFSALADSPIQNDNLRPKSISPHMKITTPKRRSSISPSRSPERRASTSPGKKEYPGTRDLKRVRVNEPKPGAMYPSLTDIESTETETEVDDQTSYEDDGDDFSDSTSDCGSLGRQVEKIAKVSSTVQDMNRSSTKVETSPFTKMPTSFRPTEDVSSLAPRPAFNASQACRQIDALIEEALAGQDTSIDTLNEEEFQPVNESPTTVQLAGKCEEAFHSNQNVSTSGDSTDEFEQTLVHNFATEDLSGSRTSVMISTAIPAGAELFSPLQDSSPLETSSPLIPKRLLHTSPISRPGSSLLRTVSVFRKQQEEVGDTPKRNIQIAVDEPIQSPSSPDCRNRASQINEVIKKLNEELETQHRSIAQVSKALLLCKSTLEFSDSRENVEGERILLIATQKSVGIQNEISRLKTEGVLSGLGTFTPGKRALAPTCHGKLIVSEIGVELKRDFVNQTLKGNSSIHHFILLLKHKHHVEASSLITIGFGMSSPHLQNGILHFPNTFVLNELEPNFEAKLEIYELKTQQEFLPHETKYRIKKMKESKVLAITPKKSKEDSKFCRVSHQHPSGPDVVRTTNFAIRGRLTIDITKLGCSHWNMDGVLFSSPVEGGVALKIQCNAEDGQEKCGFLSLFGDVNGFGSWQRFWFKLTPTHIMWWNYPDNEEAGEMPIDEFPLRLCVTTRVCPAKPVVCARANSLVVVTTRSPTPMDVNNLVTCVNKFYTATRYMLCADTRENCSAWCEALNHALANLRAWDPQAHSPDDSIF